MNFAHFFQSLPWVTIFGLLGDIFSFAMILAPIPTFYRIYKKKSTEEFQSIPYVIALFSAVLWLFYAFLKTDMIFLTTINSFGVFVETIYLVIFLVYADKKARMTAIKLILLFNVFGFGVVVFITLVIAKTTEARIEILGWFCLVFSLCVFVAPLGVMRKVIRTRSVKYMPFFLSLFLTMSAVVWFFYGLLKRDRIVAIPNILGFSFGIVQMVLYAIYRKAKPIEEFEATGKNETSKDGIILEPVKPNNGPTNDGVFAVEISSFDMINQHGSVDDEPTDQKMMNKAGINHTPPPLAVVV